MFECIVYFWKILVWLVTLKIPPMNTRTYTFPFMRISSTSWIYTSFHEQDRKVLDESLPYQIHCGDFIFFSQNLLSLSWCRSVKSDTSLKKLAIPLTSRANPSARIWLSLRPLCCRVTWLVGSSLGTLVTRGTCRRRQTRLYVRMPWPSNGVSAGSDTHCIPCQHVILCF